RLLAARARAGGHGGGRTMTRVRVIVAVGCAGALLAACKPEERLGRYKPFLAGLENGQTQTPAVAQKPKGPLATPDSAATDDGKLEVTNPDGTKTLISRCGLHLMHHIQKTLADGDDKLFATQVLSQLTQDEYKARGLDPREAFKTLKPRQTEIAKLF